MLDNCNKWINNPNDESHFFYLPSFGQSVFFHKLFSTVNIKHIIILGLASLFLFSCNTSLSETEIESLKTEITKEVDKFYEYDQATRVQLVSEFLWNDPDFIGYNDTQYYTRDELIEATKEGVKPVADYVFHRENTHIQIIDKNNVLVGVDGSLSAVLTDSTKVIYETYAATLAFRKVDNTWKVSYFMQTSGEASYPDATE